MTRASIHIEDLKEVLGSFEQLDTLQNNDGILDIDEDEDVIILFYDNIYMKYYIEAFKY